MPSEDNKILEFDQCKKSDKAPFIVYADLECIKKDWFIYNLSTTKVRENVPSGFSISKISSFRSIENKHDGYRGNDCMKKFCEFSRERSIKIINFKNKKNEVINKGGSGIMWKCKTEFYLKTDNKYMEDKIYLKGRDLFHYTGH